MDNKLRFQGLSGLDTVDSLAGTEKAVILLPGGPALAPVSMFGTGEPTSGGGGDIAYWDASVMAAAGFDIYGKSLFSALDQPYYNTPIIDNVAKTVTMPSGLNDLETLWSIGGQLPSTGKFWFEITCAFNDHDDNNYVDLCISPFGDRATAVLNDSEIRWKLVFGHTWAQSNAPGATVGYSQDVGSANTSILVCLDIDTGIIRTFSYDGEFGPVTVPPVGGQPALAGMYISGVTGVYSVSADAELVTFNVTDTGTTPWPIPVGFNPLVMEQSVLPATPEGDYLIATKDGRYKDVIVKQEYRYYVSSDLKLIDSPAMTSTALVDRKNRFQQQQTFTQDTIFPKDYLLKAGFFSLSFARQTSPKIANADPNHSWTHYSYGKNSFGAMVNGNTNFGFGEVMQMAVDSTSNVGMGVVLPDAVDVSESVGIGGQVGTNTHKLQQCVYIGHYMGNNAGFHMKRCVAVGPQSYTGFKNDVFFVAPYSGGSLTEVVDNTAIGSTALSQGTIGNANTAIGAGAIAGSQNSSFVYDSQWVSEYNTAVGFGSMAGRMGSVSYNTAVGYRALYYPKAGTYNTAIGYQAGRALLGSNNIAIGRDALLNPAGAMTDVVAIGRNAMAGLGATTNSAALGANATVTGDNQVQLGDSVTTTYTYGAVQNRSDIRDKADIRPTVLGLEFITQLRPVDYRWDMREDYIDIDSMPQPPTPIGPEPQPPSLSISDPEYQPLLLAYREEYGKWRNEERQFTIDYSTYQDAMFQWQRQNSFSSIKPDGTHKRDRFHHGFIAQEVHELAQRLGVDFGGYQDHSISGGRDVRSLGYEEFISPIIRSIQELNGRLTTETLTPIILEAFNSDALLDALADRLIARMQNPG